MTIQENVEYREKLHAKASQRGQKLTAEEKTWLVTNPIYVRGERGVELVYDVLDVEPNRNYSVKVRLESIASDEPIVPSFIVPCSKGRIRCDGHLEDGQGRPVNPKKISALCVHVSEEKPEDQFIYRSALGKMGVDYNIQRRGESFWTSSLTFFRLAGMIRTDLAENKVRYACRGFWESTYDKLVFTVEWEPL